MLLPIRYDGDGAFSAPPGFRKRCDKELVIGETLQWQTVGPRSMKSHRFYFAAVNEAWANLPETLCADFPSAEHLRKHALIKTGYCSMKRIVCGDNAEAIAAAAIMQDMDTYALCEVSGRAVTVWRANSQSIKAMGGKAFKESCDKVLTEISRIVGVDVTELRQAA